MGFCASSIDKKKKKKKCYTALNIFLILQKRKEVRKMKGRIAFLIAVSGTLQLMFWNDVPKPYGLIGLGICCISFLIGVYLIRDPK
ncbi:MAG: hypothetical protein A2249_00920 [Candidatus Jacksonbacteria bacterium RIFOXYA2_FULL_44_7]|nr:MAG: hypothetical protein A2249_00920 [Candidatus Jacksonbacteria bacterium RIFOXYA2_FULL_44_7]HCE86542.1 hypothetical protein [Candidatus Jacksonbacteria bacterium]